MKTPGLLIAIIIFSLSGMCAQTSFQNRKYTGGIFHDGIKKLKHRNKGTDKKIIPVKESVASNKVEETNSIEIKTPLQSTIDTNQTLGYVKPVEKTHSLTGLELGKKSGRTTGEKLENNSLSPAKEEKFASFSCRGNTLTGKSISYGSKIVASAPEQSFFSYLFGDFFEILGSVLIVCAGISLVLGFVYILAVVNSVFLYCLVGLILVCAGVYLLIDHRSKKNGEKGADILAFLEKVGTPILEFIFGLAAIVA